MRQPKPFRRRPEVALLIAAAVLSCAGCCFRGGCPRIDPSGQSLLIWPDEEQALAAQPLPPVTGNATAAPVGAATTTSESSRCCLCPTAWLGLASCPCCPFCKDEPAAATPVAVVTQKPPVEQVTITPERILAPIGSEVILKAGVCNQDGYLRTNRRIEWMLDQHGTGQFVTVGERGEFDMCRAPWQRPTKHDNNYAVGYTSPFYTCLDRGTEALTDDTQIRPGEAWITITSASEGVSRVTAQAPQTENWDARRATATVYWVDAQWKLPAPSAAQPGQVQTLTTVVKRQSDGAPIAGWIVRYEVIDGGSARVGYQAGSSTEVTTDAQGRATTQVAPVDDLPTTALVRATVIRPAQAAPWASPQLELGGGETTVTWSPNAPPIVGSAEPPPSVVSPSPATTPPPVFEPTPNTPPTPVAPPVTQAKPRVEVRVERVGTAPIRVGDPVPVTITLINNGDAPAERILLVDEFGLGLSSPQDTLGTRRMENARIPDLAPNDSTVVELNFLAAAPGQQCHTVTVTADRMQPVTERQCFEVLSAPPPPAAPQLRLAAAGDAVSEVGQTYTYIATVYNDAGTPAKNVVIDVVSTPELRAELASGVQSEIPGGVSWQVPLIEPNGNYKVQVQFRSVAATDAASVTLHARAAGTPDLSKTVKVEIRPSRTAAPPPAAGGDPLVGTISSTVDRLRVGETGVLNLRVDNTTGVRIEQFDFRLLFPPQLVHNMTPTTAPRQYRENQNTVAFALVPALDAGGTFTMSVPFRAVSQGPGDVVLQMRSASAPGPFQARARIEVVP